jgi:hypothetical protein
MTFLSQSMYHHASSGNYKVLSHQCMNMIPNSSVAILTAVYGTTATDIDIIELKSKYRF